MGQTPLFICGAALRAVRPLAGSRRSSPLAASLQKLGVTHPHATTLSGTDQSCITKKPASERRRASWFQASFSKTAVAALCLERDGGDDQLARLQRTQAQAVAGFDDQKITGREYLAGDEFHTTTDQVPGSK